MVFLCRERRFGEIADIPGGRSDLNTLGSRGSIFRVRNKKDARPRDHFDDTDVISTILDPFAEIRLKLVSLQSSFSH